MSYRESLTGKQTPEPIATETVSDDEDMNDEEDPECPTIKLSKEEKRRLRQPWQQTLIIKVLGRRVGYTYLAKRLHTIWHPKAKMELVALDEDYFLVKFNSVIDYEFAKYGGPWMVLEHYLIVQEWRPNFDPKSDKTERVLVWVRFPDLPVEYFDYNFLMRVGKLVGEPKSIDEATSLVSRARFAKMCIEVDITKPLLSKYKLRRRMRRIEYEGIHLVCFKCGIYGHRDDQCTAAEGKMGENDGSKSSGGQPETATDSGKRSQESPNGNIYTWNEPINLRPEISESYGPWMLAPRRGGRRSGAQRGRGYSYGEVRQNRGSNGKSGEIDEGIEFSRYAVLAVDEGEDFNTHTQSVGSPSSRAQNDNPIYEGQETRWKSRGKRPAVQTSEKQIQGTNRNVTMGQSSKVILSKDNKAPGIAQPRRNQAAAYDSHTVV